MAHLKHGPDIDVLREIVVLVFRTDLIAPQQLLQAALRGDAAIWARLQ